MIFFFQKESEKSLEREFLFGRVYPQLGLPISPLLGSASFPLGSLEPSQVLPNSLLGNVASTSHALTNPLFTGIGLNPKLAANPLLGGIGIIPPALDKSLLGKVDQTSRIDIANKRFRTLSEENDINKQFLSRLLHNNQNSLHSSVLGQNAFKTPDILSQQQQQLLALQQLNGLTALGSVPLPHHQLSQNAKKANVDFSPTRDKSQNDSLMELMILRYILGNDDPNRIFTPLNTPIIRPAALGPNSVLHPSLFTDFSSRSSPSNRLLDDISARRLINFGGGTPIYTPKRRFPKNDSMKNRVIPANEDFIRDRAEKFF